jgi:hypothetical protein
MRTKFRGITGSVEQPTRLELVVNAKAAKALRPHYPPSAPLAHHLRGIDTAPKHKVSRGLATVKPSGGPTQRTATTRAVLFYCAIGTVESELRLSYIAARSLPP